MVIGNKKGVASRGNTEYFGGEGGGVMIPVALYGFEKNRKGYSCCIKYGIASCVCGMYCVSRIFTKRQKGGCCRKVLLYATPQV